jgi:hypothetical protein
MGISSASLAGRDQELVLAMEALGIRFLSGGIKDSQTRELVTFKTKKACQIVMARLAEGNVELSTIQTLCLLSMLEFTGKLSTNSLRMTDSQHRI